METEQKANCNALGTNRTRKKDLIEQDEFFKHLKRLWDEAEKTGDLVARAKAVAGFFEERPKFSRTVVALCLGVTEGTLKRDLEVAALSREDKLCITRGENVTEVLERARTRAEKEHEEQRKQLGLDKSNQADHLFHDLIVWGEGTGYPYVSLATMFEIARDRYHVQFYDELPTNREPSRWPLERIISTARKKAEAYANTPKCPHVIYFYLYWALWWAKKAYAYPQVLATAFDRARRYFDAKPPVFQPARSQQEILDDVSRETRARESQRQLQQAEARAKRGPRPSPAELDKIVTKDLREKRAQREEQRLEMRRKQGRR